MKISYNSTEKNIAGVLNHLRGYLLARFGHINRINSKFRRLEGDLVWHQLEVVRQVIAQSKPYAEFRFIVADVLISFDREKKRGLFANNSQTCLLSQIVTTLEEVDTTSTGVLHIRDMRGLYKTIEPALDHLIELMQIWIWWDLLDASEMFLFENQLERIANLGRAPLTDEDKAYYQAAFQAITSEKEQYRDVTLENICAYELERTAVILTDAKRRREYEEIYQEIIGYENAEDHSLDQKVIQLAQHLRANIMLHESADVDESLRDFYGRVLHCERAEVTTDRAIDYEDRYIDSAKRDLSDAMQNPEISGKRYNYKKREFARAVSRLQTLQAQFQTEEPKQETA